MQSRAAKPDFTDMPGNNNAIAKGVPNVRGGGRQSGRGGGMGRGRGRGGGHQGQGGARPYITMEEREQQVL